MNIFTDVRSKLQFCSPDILQKVPEYDLIKWCEQFLTPAGNFIDIGAHIGSYSIILAKKCQNVYAFEPQKAYFECAVVGMGMNNSLNMKCCNSALGASDGIQILYQSSQNISTLCAEIPKFTGQKILQEDSVVVKKLDDFGFQNIVFLKIDVEGSELDVIKGASLTLLNNNFPPFIFKVYNDSWYKSQKELILAHVRALGYKVEQMSDTHDMCLASEHPLWPLKLPIKSIRDIKYDMSVLLKRYQAKELQTDPEITWDVWYELAHYFRNQSKHQNAYDCAIRGLKLSPPADHEYKLYEEIAIVAYYIDKKREGYDACENVVFSHAAPWLIRNYTLNNQSFYMVRTPFKKTQEIKYQLPPDFIASSSAIIPKDNGEFLVNMLAVNYTIGPKGSYTIRDRENVVRNRNFLLTLDKDMKVKSGKELVDNSGIQLYPKETCGIGDIRLFGTNEFFCNYIPVNKESIPQICYCRYDPVTAEVTSIKPLMVGSELKPEKNWLPFIMNDEVHFIYSISPLRLYKLNRETGETTLVKEEYLSKRYLDDFRGSASLIPYRDGWLGTCHQVHKAHPCTYFHRFIWFDKDFTTLRYSDVFYFESINIEYNLALCHTEDALLLLYSERDNSSKIGYFSYGILDAWLKF